MMRGDRQPHSLWVAVDLLAFGFGVAKTILLAASELFCECMRFSTPGEYKVAIED